MKSKLAAGLLLAFSIAGFAQNSKDTPKANERAAGSVKIFQQFAALGDDSVPMSLYRDAKAIAVFPNTNKVTILLSQMTVGRGLASVRLADGWSTPAFVTLKGSDMNLKIAGKKSFDVVILFMDEKAVEQFKKVGVASNGGKGKGIKQGPVVKGPGSEAVTKDPPALYYVFENGQLVDYDIANNALLGLFSITQDNDLNKVVFGAKAKELFDTSTHASVSIADVDKFRALLMETAPAKSVVPTQPIGEISNEK